MKNTTVLSEFVSYTSMNVLGMLGLSCYILADTFFVAKGLGADGLTALNLAIPLYSFVHGSGLMVGMGGATKYSILKGNGDVAGARPLFTKAMQFGGILAAMYFVLGLFFADELSVLLGADGAVYQMTFVYLRVILLFAPAFICNNMLLCFVRNDGGPHLAMAAMLLGSFSNVVLDYIFIFPCGMGMFGAVLATGLSPIISMLLLSVWFIKGKQTFSLVRTRLDGRTAGELSALGAPSLIVELSSGTVIIVFNLLILSLRGNVGVAAYGVIANLSLVALSIFTGLGQGIQPLVSRSYGRGELGQAKQVYQYALVAALAFSLMCYAFIFLCADPIVAVFNGEGDVQLQEIARQGLRLYFLALPMAGFNMISAVCLASMDRPQPAFFISILRGFLMILPLAFLMAYLLEMTGVWLAFPTAEGATAVITGLLMMRTMGKIAKKG